MASAQKPPSDTKHALKHQATVPCHRELNARSMGDQCLEKEFLRHRKRGDTAVRVFLACCVQTDRRWMVLSRASRRGYRGQAGPPEEELVSLVLGPASAQGHSQGTTQQTRVLTTRIRDGSDRTSKSLRAQPEGWEAQGSLCKAQACITSVTRGNCCRSGKISSQQHHLDNQSEMDLTQN